MENYTPNNKPAERKKVEKVVTTDVKVRKKSKFSDVFISEDAGNVGNYVVMEVIVPAVKNLVCNIIKDGIDMLLWGGARRNNSGTPGSRVNYGGYYNNQNNVSRTAGQTQTRTGYSYDTITFNNRPEALEVLNQMDMLIDSYGQVTVADLYDLVGITGEYTDQKYGWKNLHNANVVRDREGFRIDLPKALPLN